MKLGVTQVDITPDYPVRLSGFGFRRTESEGITHRIWAKALAIDDQVNGPAGARSMRASYYSPSSSFSNASSRRLCGNTTSRVWRRSSRTPVATP